MQTRNISISTQYKEHPYTWYAVVATALQMPADFEEEISELSWGPVMNNHNFIEKSISPLTTTLISFDPSNHRTPSITTFSEVEAISDFDGDIVIKPKYTQEFKLKVRSIKIDKSLPKIFID